MRRLLWIMLVAVGLIALSAPPARTENLTAGISGTVTDESQAAVPGVTVEAASPSLIERARTTTSGAEGRYTFVDLVPGTYSVTFTLSEFKTFVRDGITINAGLTATVNAVMAVGALEESITVSGAAPVVDIQNVRRLTTYEGELAYRRRWGQKGTVTSRARPARRGRGKRWRRD